MNSFDLVSSLQALPETDAVELDGIQFGGNNTCSGNNSGCLLLITVVQTVCALALSC